MGKYIKKWVKRKIFVTTVATGGGCLIPLLIIVAFLAFSGWISSITVFNKYKYDKWVEEMSGTVENIKDTFFDLFYGDVGDPNIFTEQVLKSMVFDRKSIKTMLQLVDEYNSDKLDITLNVKFKGYYYRDRYRNGKYVGQKKVTTYTWEEIYISDAWIREKYPIDWQVVYLFCYYDSLDNGNKSTDFDENGKKIRLKKSYIEKVIEDVASECYDIAADYTFFQGETYNRRGKLVDTHDLFVKEYKKWKVLKKATQANVEDYGAYISHSFSKPVNWKYTANYSGYIPVTKLAGVQTLTTYERYRYGRGQQGPADLMQVTYDISKLEGLIETYGNGRDIKTFIFALEKLPGGEEIAEEIEYAMIKVKEQEKKEQEEADREDFYDDWYDAN